MSEKQCVHSAVCFGTSLCLKYSNRVPDCSLPAKKKEKGVCVNIFVKVFCRAASMPASHLVCARPRAGRWRGWSLGFVCSLMPCSVTSGDEEWEGCFQLGDRLPGEGRRALKPFIAVLWGEAAIHPAEAAAAPCRWPASHLENVLAASGDSLG